MTKKLPKANRLARQSVLAKIAVTNFHEMSQSKFGDWVNALPVLEFLALIDLNGEAARREFAAEPEPEYVAPYTADDPAGTWVDCVGADQPVDGETIVWVTCHDGEVDGPNRADAFIWDGEFITAYAVAKNPKPRPDEGD